MNTKVVITLILGLVFQLAQVLPGATFASPCPTHTESCSCCKAAQPCQCAHNNGSDQKPEPAPIEAGTAFKLPAARVSETGIAALACAGSESIPVPPAFSHTGHPSGFCGVRLSVAFCTFVI